MKRSNIKSVMFHGLIVGLFISLCFPMSYTLAADDIQEEEVALDISDDTLQMGGFPDAISQDSILHPDNCDDEFLDELYGVLDEAISNKKEQIDVSDYGLSEDDTKELVSSFLNDNPQDFYVEGVNASINTDDNCVCGLSMVYSDDDRQEEYENKINEILIKIDPDWNDEEKVFFIHDYLIINTEYDTGYYTDSIDPDSYTAYGAICKQVAVCAGYSLAFKDIACRTGIKADYVTSDKLNHAWNVVEIDGEGYYSDCTWDDSANDDYRYFDQYCEHTYFLLSEQGLKVKRHDSDDWVAGNKNINGLYNDTRYDSAEWRNANYSPVVFEDGGIRYLNSIDGSLYKYGCDGGSSVKLGAIGAGAYWPAYGTGMYYPLTFGTLQKCGNKEFVNDFNTIYMVDEDDDEFSLSLIYSLSDEESDKGFIYGISVEGSEILYDIATGYKNTEKTGSGRISVSQYVTLVSLDKAFLSYRGLNDEAQELSVNTVIGEGNIEWYSSNEGVAEFSDGKVKPVGYGETYITASLNGSKARCRVVVLTNNIDPINDGIPGVDYGLSVSENLPMDYKVEKRDGFEIGYYHSIPFWGKSKLKLSNFGKIKVSCGGAVYNVSKVKINKKQNLIQITGLEGADRKLNKAIKASTKGSNGIGFIYFPYYVKDSDDVSYKDKSDGDIKGVRVNIKGKKYKIPKNDWIYDDGCIIRFSGDKVNGYYTVMYRDIVDDII